MVHRPLVSPSNVILRSCVLSNFLQLAKICQQKFGVDGERCLLFPTSTVANHCRAFIIQQAAKDNVEFSVRIAQFLHPDGKGRKLDAELYIVLFPADGVQYAQHFWGHTGLGISSRYAEHCLSLLPGETVDYSVKEEQKPLPTAPNGALSEDCSTSLEERCGRDLPQDAFTLAKRTLRRRIAGWSAVGSASSELQPSARDLRVTEDDVYLYPTGMAAIWNAHQTIYAVRPAAKSVGFGFVFDQFWI